MHWRRSNYMLYSGRPDEAASAADCGHRRGIWTCTFPRRASSWSQTPASSTARPPAGCAILTRRPWGRAGSCPRCASQLSTLVLEPVTRMLTRDGARYWYLRGQHIRTHPTLGIQQRGRSAYLDVVGDRSYSDSLAACSDSLAACSDSVAACLGPGGGTQPRRARNDRVIVRLE